MTIIIDDWQEEPKAKEVDRVTIKLAGATYKIQESRNGGLLLVKYQEEAEPFCITLVTDKMINVK